MEPRSVKPSHIKNIKYINSTYNGCWYPAVKLKEMVKEGQVLGEVRDFYGNIVETFYAEQNGIILYYVHYLAVFKHASLLAYGQIKE